jgi:hypothetical protein
VNRKIFLSILAFSQNVSNADVTWVVDITNCNSQQIYVGDLLGVNLDGNCWHIPINNDFYTQKPLPSRQTIRMSTVEIYKVGTWPHDVCDTNLDINKFMETFIGENKVKFQAEYHPEHNSIIDDDPLRANPLKKMWHVVVNNQQDFSTLMAAVPSMPYVHITYNMDHQMSVLISSQENTPSNFHEYNLCKNTISSNLTLLSNKSKKIQRVCTFPSLAVGDVSCSPVQYSTISWSYFTENNNIIYSSRDNDTMPRMLEVPLNDDYIGQVIFIGPDKYSWKTDEFDEYEISRNNNATWTIRKNGNVLAVDATCSRL